MLLFDEAHLPAEQPKGADCERKGLRVLRARVAGWSERVEASWVGFVECLTPCRRIARVPPSHLDQSPSCRLSGRPGTLPRSRAIFDRCRDWTVARTCVVLVRLSRRQWSAVIRSASRLSLMPSAAPAMVRREKRFYLTPYSRPAPPHSLPLLSLLTTGSSSPAAVHIADS